MSNSFSLSAENIAKAELHMMIEILSTNYANKELLTALLSRQLSIEEKEFAAKVDKRLDKIRQDIHDKIFEEFGDVDLVQFNSMG